MKYNIESQKTIKTNTLGKRKRNNNDIIKPIDATVIITKHKN